MTLFKLRNLPRNANLPKCFIKLSSSYPFGIIYFSVFFFFFLKIGLVKIILPEKNSNHLNNAKCWSLNLLYQNPFLMPVKLLLREQFVRLQEVNLLVQVVKPSIYNFT